MVKDVVIGLKRTGLFPSCVGIATCDGIEFSFVWQDGKLLPDGLVML